MENFMDKLAEKLNAGEIIRANRAADQQEMEKMQLKVREYEKYLEQATLAYQKLKASTEELKASTEELKASTEERNRQSQEDCKELGQIMQVIAERQQRALEDAAVQNKDHVHKESVKVYRNVQAVIQEENAKLAEQVAELKALVEAMKEENATRKTPGIVKGILGVSLISMLLAAASVAFWVLTYLQII